MLRLHPLTSFPNGQVITVTDEEDADWYYGEYVDNSGAKQEGLFPRNFVKMYEPETPPRPARLNRPKKELGSSPVVKQEEELRDSPTTSVSTAEFAAPVASPEDARSVEEPRPDEPSRFQATKPAESIPVAPPTNLATKPATAEVSKAAPPTVNDKPSSGSFRDRINAFNKPAAPPVAPKPGASGASAGSGYVKKSFVAPPPSKNAYVPPPREALPQTIYRREEDPDIARQAINTGTTDPLPSIPPPSEEEGDQPKPTSLKDRIALLQKQQLEQATRHAEAAQKKEKPKRPPKKRMESQERGVGLEDVEEGRSLDKVTSAGTTGSHPSNLVPTDEAPEGHSTTASMQAETPSQITSPPLPSSKDFQSDANDADQSGAEETEEGEEFSAEKDESDEKPRTAIQKHGNKVQQAPGREPNVGDEEDDTDGEEEEQEEEVDPEVKRRMEIRERMAKMSGGMGMAGMFGPPGGIPGMAPKKQTSMSSERKGSGHSAGGMSETQTARAPPVPIMPMPGLQKVRSPEQDQSLAEVDQDTSEPRASIVHEREPDEMPDVEDVEEEPTAPSRRSIERPAPPPPAPQDRPVPVLPTQARNLPPPLPTERPTPPIPPESRPIPRPPPSQPLSPSAGSESDDEMPSVEKVSTVTGSAPGSSNRTLPAPPPASAVPPLPHRPREPPPMAPSDEPRATNTSSTEASPISPKDSTASSVRTSRVPPVPAASSVVPPPATLQARAPPPPPPSAAPPGRTSTSDSRSIPAVPQTRPQDDSDEEITEYEGDYDTDMAPDATHKDALKSHAKPASLEGDSTENEETLHHSGLPSLGPTTRAVPPPPPNQPPRSNRMSGDMPRAPPPPPPPKEQTATYEEEYDPYNYTAPQPVPSKGLSTRGQDPTTMRTEDDHDDLYSASPPRRPKQPPQSQTNTQYSPPSQTPPQRAPPRQSLDVQRSSTSARRSVDAPRPSGEHGSIAGDIDLGHASQWWRQQNVPPPVFQNRRDIVYEVEESSTTRRGGRQSVTKVVYVLFMDYSQTTLTALFDPHNPAEVTLEQHHEPPPARLRQDQLEDAHSQYGAHIAEEANSAKDTVVGDGSPQALVLGLLSSHPDALRPVGTRAYGALVYANLANATVQQFDEIRPGDIVSFRNTKFQGHRGPMHSKYSIEIGKPDHVAVVVDWDGTKKKVRAWEQGRENKKVKMESFKLGDMRSGEAKVWRVMPRKWVGWEGQN